jgi:eukaryotic-like serine/threonine-protein kinase
VLCSGSTTHFQEQIGYISYPDASFHVITRDTNNYNTLTLSSDGKMLATVQERTTRAPYLLPALGWPKSLPAAAPLPVPGISFLNWEGNDDLLVTDGTDLFRVSRDGSRRTTLLSDSAGFIYAVSACGSDHIVLSWLGHNPSAGHIEDEIWRVNSDGSNPLQIASHTGLVRALTCSPDGKMAYYPDSIADQIMEIPTDGGKPEVVPGTVIPNEFVVSSVAGLSPDGKQLPFFSHLSQGGPQNMSLDIVALNAGPNPPLRTLKPDPRTSGWAEFTPDGKAISYPITENGVSNLWIQPLDGSPGRQITHFTSGVISSGGWSPDGKILALLRSNTQSDIVLLRESAQ